MRSLILAIIAVIVLLNGFWLPGLIGIALLLKGSLLLLISYLKYKKHPEKTTKLTLYFGLVILLAGILHSLVELTIRFIV